MTAARPWASAACLAGRPDDCPRVKDDGRRCVNPAHNAYPDDLQPAGVQPALPGTLEPPVVETPTRRRRWTCDRCGDLVIRTEHVTGTRKDPVYACDTCDHTDWEPMDDPHGIFPGPVEVCACGATRCEGIVRTPADGIFPDPTDDDPHEWPADLADRLEGDGDPHDALAEAANIVVVGRPRQPGKNAERAALHAGSVLPHGNNPDSVDLADQVNAAIRAKGYAEPDPFARIVDDDVRRAVNQRTFEALGEAFRAHHATRGYRVLIVPERPPELTAGEVKRITAAHMVLRPEQALDVTRTIITERLTNPEGIDQ